MIAIAGAANSGKDSLLHLLKERLPFQLRRFSLGDILKQELYQFVMENFGISTFTEDREEKNLIRPLMVEYARIKRLKSEGRYFVDKVDRLISDYREHADPNCIPALTDLRFAQFKRDELYWAKVERNAYTIFITRIENNGSHPKPINDEEANNNPKIFEQADYRLCWKSFDNEPDLEYKLNDLCSHIKTYLKKNYVFE